VDGDAYYWSSVDPQRDTRAAAKLAAMSTAAIKSSPDALGLISWNEFSENSHVEPSVAHGNRYLAVLRNITGTPVPTLSPLAEDSSGTGDPGEFPVGLVVAGGMVLLPTILLVLMIRRRRRSGGPSTG
jgi:hypothetical protein